MHCTQEVDVLTERLTERGETYTDLNDLPTLVEAYEEVALSSFLPIVSARLDRDSHWQKTAEGVLDLAEKFNKSSLEIVDTLPYYLGNPHPEVVICVDKGDSLLLTGEDDLQEDHCLRQILTYIPDKAWHITAIVNPYNLPMMQLRRLKSAKVVAIGKPVSDYLIKYKVKHGGIVRPETVAPEFLPGWGQRLLDMAVSQRFQLPGV